MGEHSLFFGKLDVYIQDKELVLRRLMCVERQQFGAWQVFLCIET